VDRVGTFESVLEQATSRRGAMLVGVCNVTPDSFSDGGEHLSMSDALARVDGLLAEGADMIDIGGESTRPGAEPVAPAEQLTRVLEVVRYAARRAPVSVDTSHAEVAEACLEAGACTINDTSCGRDERLLAVASAHRAAYVLMHSRGPQQQMRGFSTYPDEAYGDVVVDVLAEWHEAAQRVRAAGVPAHGLVMDPGLGFAKNANHSVELLRRVGELAAGAGVPVMIGASRKSFLKTWDDGAEPKDRLGASLAAALLAAAAGARLLRVHDVRATRQALDLWRAMTPSPPDTEPKLSLAPPAAPSSSEPLLGGDTIRPPSGRGPDA
jgi:dihydropteroate synthase